MFKKIVLIVFTMLLMEFVSAQQVFYFETNIAENITGATYDPAKKQVLFFSGNNVFFYPFGSQQTIVPEWYNLADMETVDAAVSWDEKNALFFSGGSYRMFDHESGALVTELTNWPGLPPAWGGELDAAVRWDANLIFFFYNEQYVVYSIPEERIVDGNDITTWQGWPASWGDGIDDAFNPGDGFIYFIRAGEIMPYSVQDQAFFNPLMTAPSQNGTAASSSGGSSVNPNGGLPGSNSLVNSKKKSSNGTVASPSMPAAPMESTLKGCITGLPSGNSGFREMISPLQGEESGRVFTDNFPKGYRIATIKVFTSKIWGKSVIAGLQCILMGPDGQKMEQTPLGKRTISQNDFNLEADECVTGIEGTKNGISGNFIYSLQIVTSKRKSSLYGERTTDNSSQSFSLSLPTGGVFNGFAGSFNNNMTGIGIKYVGQSEMQSTASAGAATSPSLPGGNSGVFKGGQGSSPYNNPPAGSPSLNGPKSGPSAGSDYYSDDYEDYTKELGNDAMWMVQPMPGLDWLGAGFDILSFDPLNPNETKNRKQFRAIVITNSGERAGNKAQYLKPYGTEFGSVNSGSDVDSSSWVTSYRSFANSFSLSASGSVKIPEVASGSLSGSYKEMNSTSVGSESIYYFTKIMRKIHEVDLKPIWLDQFSGKKYKQKIHPSFKADVASLPVMSGPIPGVSANQMVKGQKLSSPFEQIKSKYLNMIAKYGTHYASHVGWGGQYISRTEIKRADYERARMTQTDFQNTAELTIKKVTVGRSVEFGMGTGNSNGTSSSVFRRQTYVQGGNGETDLDRWRDKVDQTPAPVEIFFTPYSDLLTKEIFPEDPDIEKKSALMRLITEKYLVDEMRPPVEGKNDFFRPIPDLPVPGQISITNNGGYVMNFSVSWVLNGVSSKKESGNYTLGFTKNIEIPVGAKNIKLKVNYYYFIGSTKVLFEKSFDKPEVKCYKVWGTTFSQGYAECDE